MRNDSKTWEKATLNRLQKSLLWNKHFVDYFFLHLNSQRNNNFSGSFQPFVLIRKKLVIFVHFKGFNISQKPKSSPLPYFAQKTSLNLAPNWYPIIFMVRSGVILVLIPVFQILIFSFIKAFLRLRL